MFFISKKQLRQLVPTNANLAMVFICKRFQNKLQVDHFKSHGVSTGFVHVKTIAIFITHVQCLVETLLSNIRCGIHR